MDPTESWLDSLLAGEELPAPRDDEPSALTKLREVVRRSETDSLRLKDEALTRIAETLMRLATRDFDVFLDPSTDDDTVNAAFIGISMMAEELAHSQHELERARDAALAASRSKSTFLANMSHELRTPLNAIIGYCELLHDDAAESDDSAGIRRDLERVLTAAHHLLGLISDVLDLSKIEAGRMDLEITEVNLNAIIAEVADTLAPVASGKDIALDVQIDEPITVRGDSLRLKQVLLNLLGNAIKFTATGGVTLTASTDGDDATIAVIDTGVGVASDQLQSIFDPFIQAQRTHGGTGLGLAISRQLVRIMNGDIQAESTLGEGSTFTVRLTRSIGRRISVPEATLPRLLVVDDDMVFHDLVKRHLVGFRCELFSAHNGREALDKLPEIVPDLIILDIIMPTMDGWSTLTHIKAHPDMSSIPVVVVSITDRSSDARVLAAADYLVKPVQRKALIDTVTRLVKPEGRRVLVVDDEDSARELVRRTIARLGCEVIEAANGVDALEILREGRVDLVLLDLQMPLMDGFQTVAEMRRDPSLAGVPVVVVTAKDLDANERTVLAGQVSRIVSKTKGRTALVNAICAAIG